ncbi:PaaX family transcriptional regulator C-terminal domain-containing protein [Primorskyibacter sp. S87]|uniref:PaaX family transcriptional regulator C-terminal domain-containing protein n=1 Tax=Primorskyibacter sp. S87 TaxID=3415126 RepID=UPI003C7C4AAE
MAQNDLSWFDASVSQLIDPQNQRVWSLIVSLFGDLAQRPGDRISGGALTRILHPLGLKPEAIRVALHRLRKDGWIDSDRIGRESVHYLTEFGRARSAEVTPRIYDRDPAVADHWHLLVAEDGQAVQSLNELLLTRPYLSLGRNVALGADDPPAECEDLLVFEVTARAVPSWVQDRLFPTDLREACDSLRQAAENVSKSRAGKALTPLQVATLRTLVVHRWRRVVLRHPDLPEEFSPVGWTGPACRSAVFKLLDTLPFPGLKALESDRAA